MNKNESHAKSYINLIFERTGKQTMACPVNMTKKVKEGFNLYLLMCGLRLLKITRKMYWHLIYSTTEGQAASSTRPINSTESGE